MNVSIIVNEYNNKTELFWVNKGNCKESSSYKGSHLVTYRNQ